MWSASRRTLGATTRRALSDRDDRGARTVSLPRARARRERRRCPAPDAISAVSEAGPGVDDEEDGAKGGRRSLLLLHAQRASGALWHMQDEG